ncbi:MAG TPA: sialidase family protein [Thermoanaerobaculia bacterium]|nr:sialidase family protein [Thermoanaerobaculia bacterium]
MALLPLLLLAAVTGASNVTLLAPGGDLAETSLAQSGDRIVMAAMAHTAPAPIEIFVSRDGGLEWEKAAERGLSVGGKTYSYAGDPTMVTLDDGTFGLAYLTNSATYAVPQGQIVLVYERSADGTAWSAPIVIDDGPSYPFLFVDKPTISVDPIRGTLVLTWTRNPFGAPSQNMIAISTDRGATWSTPRAMSSGESSAQAVATADGTLVVTSLDLTNGKFLARFSADGGASFSAPQEIGVNADFFRLPPTNAFSPAVQSTAAFRGDVYCAYPTRTGVFFTRSRDGGKTWSAPLPLAGAHGYAILPSLAVDEVSGDVVVSWLDARDDPDQATFRLYAAQSHDGGATFDAPLAFSPSFGGGSVMGDYNGSLVIQKGVVVTTFSASGGYLNAARLVFAPPPTRRRAARH